MDTVSTETDECYAQFKPEFDARFGYDPGIASLCSGFRLLLVVGNTLRRASDLPSGTELANLLNAERLA